MGVVGSLVCIVLAIINSTMVRKAAQKWSGYKSVWMLLGYGLTPVYLYKRARALKHSLGYFWLSIVAVVSSILIAQPNLLSHSTYWGFGLPECNNAYAAGKVKEIFVQMPLAASAGLYALEVTDAAELSSDKLKRACHATIRTNKGTRLPVSFTMERATEQASEFYVRLLIDDPTDLLRITPQSQ